MKNEAEFQNWLQKELRQLGCFVFKTHGGMYSVPGIPDLIGCSNGKFFGIECKVTKRKKLKLDLDGLMDYSMIQLQRFREICDSRGIAFGITYYKEINYFTIYKVVRLNSMTLIDYVVENHNKSQFKKFLYHHFG